MKIKIYYMKNLRFIIFTFTLFLLSFATAQTRGVANNAIPGDNTMRYYRLALPITLSAFQQDLESDYNKVQQFWQECEDFANRMFVPLGICFDVVEDARLVMPSKNLIDENIYNTTSFGTELTDAAIGSANYDVGMWVHHRDEFAENSGLSVGNGVYNSSTKSSGYAKTDKWVVAHELGHMFGADFHTIQGEGSLMDNEGEFFSYPSILLIREESVNHGTSGTYTYKSVTNSAPVFDATVMKDTYTIPQGACLAIPLSVTDNNDVTYSAIGCSSANIRNVNGEDGYVPHFKSLQPQASNIIDYRPMYRADINDEGYYLVATGTNIPSMAAGSYSIAFLVNDMPSSTAYDYLLENPFYSNYAVWDANIEIVGGTTPFDASLSPKKDSYSAGEPVTVKWGVNHSYFTTESRVRITMSTNYGESFDYVLAESVPATDGSCVVTLPNVNVGNVDVDFITAVRSMRGGIIRVEEIGGIAYTLTTLTPENGGGFNVTGGSSAPVTTYNVAVSAGEGGSAATSATSAAEGDKVTLTATPDDNYTFDGWYNGNTFVSDANPYEFTVKGNVNYTAEFKKKDAATYAISVKSNNPGGLAFINTTGVVEGEYTANTVVELIAVEDYENSGFLFLGWYKNDKCVSIDKTYKLNVTEAATFEARFVKGCLVSTNSSRICYVTIYDADGKNPSPGRMVVNSGTTVLLEAYIDPYYQGYVFVGWYDAQGKLCSKDLQYRCTVTGDVSYTAVVELAHYNLTVSTPDNTMGSVRAASGTVEPGTTIEVGYNTPATISAIPANNNYLFVNWTKNGVVVAETAEYDIPAVTDVNAMADVEYVAHFVERTEAYYGVSASAEPNYAGYVNISAKEVTAGGSITLTANAYDGYKFVKWMLDGEVVSTDAVLTVNNIQQNLIYNAYFESVNTDPFDGRWFRLKEKNSGKYLDVDHEGGADNAHGQVKLSVKNNESEKQIVLFEKSGDEYKLKSMSGYYIKGEKWNVNASSNKNDAALLMFEETGNVSEFRIKWYNTNNNGDLQYFKVGTADQDNSGIVYVYCDAKNNGEANQVPAVWVLEEVELADKSALQELIAQTTDLLNSVATIGPKKINIQGKITSNAAHNTDDGNEKGWEDGAGIAGLTDNDPATYFHSRWNGAAVNEAHYLQVDLSDAGSIGDFAFEYAVRKAGNSQSTSPAPTKIEVRVSSDGVNFGNPVATYASGTNANSLPLYTDLGKTLWNSGMISAGKKITHIRLTVTASAGPGGNKWKDHFFFAMGTLNIYRYGYVANADYEHLVTITEELLDNVFKALESANEVNDKNLVTTEEVETARLALLAQKEALVAAMNFEPLASGQYYTFQCVGSNKFLSSDMDKNNNNRLQLKSSADKSCYFYKDDSGVLAYSGGKYMGVKSANDKYNVTLLEVGETESVIFHTDYAVNHESHPYYISLGSRNEFGTNYRFAYGIGDRADSGVGSKTGIQALGNGYEWVVAKAAKLPVEITDVKFTTFYAPLPVSVPNGVTAYYLADGVVKNSRVQLTEIEEKEIPAGTGVILTAETPGVYDFEILGNSSLKINNLFEGTVASEYITEEAYVLAQKNGVIGLYLAEMNKSVGSGANQQSAFLNNGHRVYLPKDKLVQGANFSSELRFLFPGATAVEEVEAENGSVDVIYDLSGRKLENITKPGIYIVNGQKRIVR